MRLRELTLREIHLDLLHPFETSMDRVTSRRILLAEANVDGVIGWGECTAGENPFYSPEDTETCWHILTNYIWPALKGKEFHSAADIWHHLGIHPWTQHGRRRPSRPPSGMPKPSKREFRSGNYWAARNQSSPAAFPSASKTPSKNSSPP